MTPADPPDQIELAHAPRFTLGGMEVRPATRELVAGGGSEVLEPRIMQVLVALARRRGQVVSRDGLIASCWGGRAVGEDAINRCVQAIRRLAQAHGGFSVTTVSRVGYRLDESALPFAKPAAPSVFGNERRRLTVLACGLVRTPGARLDPEAVHAIVTQYRRAATETVETFDGFVATGRGDDLVAYFGYPEAREDAAECAVRAGLAVVEAVATLSERLGPTYGVSLSVRVGVHAGTVLVAPEGDDVEMFGETLDVVSIVQAQAPAGAVLITSAVNDLVSGRLGAEPRGALTQDGEAEIELFEAAPAVPAPGRKRGRSARFAAPFVGRGDEMRLLLGRWERVREGEGQLAVVCGEPGIGKTRLIDEFKESVAADDPLRIEGGAAQLYANTPYHLMSQLLEQALGGEDDPAERLRLLERALERTALEVGEAVHLLAPILRLPLPEAYPPLSLAPDRRRGRLLAAAAEWLLSLAGNRLVLIVVEDLHWVDPSSMELLRALAEQGAAAPVMLLASTRPQLRQAWAMRAHHSLVTLDRLSHRDTRGMVAGLCVHAGLPEAVLEAVVRRSDGVPLFVGELTRLLLEGDETIGADGVHHIPATLVDSLTVRLDRLGAAKEIAQVGAVIGRDFTYPLLRAVSGWDDEALMPALQVLADADLILARGSPPTASYRFRHALIQDAAYEGQLRARRRLLHDRVARTITERFMDLARAQPEVVARHWLGAGEAANAIASLREAADEATRRGAYVEAVGSLRHALEALATTPPGAHRDREELILQHLLSPRISLAHGYGAAELEPVLTRWRELSESLGDRVELYRSLLALHDYYASQGNQASAHEIAVRVAEMAKGMKSAAGVSNAHFVAGLDAFLAGDFIAALASFDQAAALRPMTDNIVDDQMRFWCIWYAVRCLLALGRFQEAHDRAAAVVPEAEERAAPLLAAVAHWGAAIVESVLGHYDDALRHAERLATLAGELGLSSFIASATLQRAGILIRRGRYDEALALAAPLYEPGRRAAGAAAQVSALCWARGQVGQAALGLERLDPVLARALETADASYLPSLRRIRAELLLVLDPKSAEAEAELRAAIEIARAQQAKWYELKATTSLARLLAARGRAPEARPMLAQACAWFPDPFDNDDVKRAKALLEELGG